MTVRLQERRNTIMTTEDVEKKVVPKTKKEKNV